MMKAGLMEAGDVFVINKYDREGGDRLAREIRGLLEVVADRRVPGSWVPPIVPAVGIRGEGGPELLAAARRHREHAEADAERARRLRLERTRERLRTLVRARLLETEWERLGVERWLEEAAPSMARREASPYTLVEGLLDGGRRR
jgi:LAO/AO transport system kinase